MKETKDTKVYDIDVFRSAVIDWLSVGYPIAFPIDRLTLVDKKNTKVIWRITYGVSNGPESGVLTIESSEDGGSGQIDVWFYPKGKGFGHELILP